MTSFISMSQIDEDRKPSSELTRLGRGGGPGGGRGQWGVTAKGYAVSSRDDENVLKLDGDGRTPL